VRNCITNRGVAHDVVTQDTSPQTIQVPGQHTFNSPVLISKLDFEMQNLFSVADEPEMTRLYNSCVNGTNSNLMKLFSFNAVKRVIGHDRRLVSPVIRIPNRLEPWMPLKHNTIIFMYFPFIHVQLRDFLRKRQYRPSVSWKFS